MDRLHPSKINFLTLRLQRHFNRVQKLVARTALSFHAAPKNSFAYDIRPILCIDATDTEWRSKKLI